MEDSVKPFFEWSNAIVFLLVVFLPDFAEDFFLGYYKQPFLGEIVSDPVNAFLETLGEFGHFIVVGEIPIEVEQDRVFRHCASTISSNINSHR